MKPDSPRVVIVGAGISGLATAFYLKRLGIRSTIVEQSARLGGLIQTERRLDCDLEAGPDSFISTKPAVAELAGDLGIMDQLQGSNDIGRRVFVVRHGRLLPMPKGMVMMVPSDWKAALQSPLFSAATKARFFREYAFRPLQRTGDFSIAEMMVPHFGREALEYLTEPLLSGVYGGHAASLSAPSVLPRFVEYEQKVGSLIRGVRSSPGKPLEIVRQNSGKLGTVPAQNYANSLSGLFLSFRGGMGTLIDCLAGALGTETEMVEAAAESVHPTEHGWEVRVARKSLPADHVVLACPAYRSAVLVEPAAKRLAELLSAIPYSSSLLVTLLFRQKEVTHPLDGFGFLVPPPERRTIAAVTWVNTKFPSRVSPGLVAIRAFLVDPEASNHAVVPDSEVIQNVLIDLQLFMGLHAIPVHAAVHRWPHSMPQYVVGHAARISAIQEELSRLPGLHLSSNFLDGVGIPDCVRNAKSVASLVAK